MPAAIRDARASDLPAIAALYGREVAGETATFELEPPGGPGLALGGARD